MAIWTSRYSNKELQNGKYYPVGISVGRPRWSLGYQLREQCYSLAPKGCMLNMNIEKYKPEYIKKLENIGKSKIFDIVNELNKKAQGEGKELVLLCFEDIRIPSEWCHRTMFAEWWAEQTGELIDELYDPSEPKIKKIKATEKKEEIKESAPEETGQMSIFDLVGAEI